MSQQHSLVACPRGTPVAGCIHAIPANAKMRFLREKEARRRIPLFQPPLALHTNALSRYPFRYLGPVFAARYPTNPS